MTTCRYCTDPPTTRITVQGVPNIPVCDSCSYMMTTGRGSVRAIDRKLDNETENRRRRSGGKGRFRQG